MTGRKIVEKVVKLSDLSKIITIETGSLPAGVYLLVEVINSNGVASGKIMLR
ncbi:MAG: hypothetical protein KUL83_11480 [Lentimicrobium sp.]|jgi:hypothetical protein|nr:hypothetical protein [Lentimicrobium sp.]MDD2526492.1 hypothetical protein [Lentimicrobiaceae bacterium]MDD4596374.1 hypothetical protein [Lentimicrobiaceae bacterium]MDY0025914.1 hypothetical protein [Lentimicrobium sp.]